MTTPRREDLISRESAAAHLGVHRNTIARYEKTHGLRKFRLRGNNSVFYLRSEVEKIEPIVEVTGTPA